MKLGKAVRAGAAVGTLALATTVAASPAIAAGQSVTDLSDPAVLSIEQLAQSLVGDETKLSNVEYTGAPEASGLAKGFTSVFGIDGGVALTTGSLGGPSGILKGPNGSDSKSDSFGEPGDSDLDKIVKPNSTNDASVLEFDFVPSSNKITFSYVFGSDEYQEYVDSSYNDVFAFYVNGTNFATVDTAKGKVPVTINTINHKLNSEFYRDNYVNRTSYNTELDGFTTLLTFEAPVTAGKTNHIKLAIADTSDDALDSAVMIAAGSFKSNNPPVAEDLAKATEFETPVDITLEGTDVDKDKLTYEILEQPDAGQGVLSALEGDQLTFTPAEGFTGEASFTYRASDGSAFSEPATVTITVLAEGEVIATPTPTATATPTASPSPTASPTPSSTPSASSTPTPSSSASPSASVTSSASATASETSSASTKPSASSSASATSGTASASSSSAAPLGSDSEDNDDLADTGSNGSLLAMVAGGILVAGGAAIFATQRRRNRH